MGNGTKQAVLVHLDATGLSDEVYRRYDVTDLEDQLEEAIQQAEVGEYDGNEFGPGRVTLFMYGPDAEALFRVVEPILRDYALCRNALIEIDTGDAPVRKVCLPNFGGGAA
jgi:hypothetical protein